VLIAIGPPVVRVLKARTATIPIVFEMGEDPVKEGQKLVFPIGSEGN
jgi:hypothetical protein